MYWYMYMNGIERDEKAQKNGVVCVILTMKDYLQPPSGLEMDWFTRWQNRVVNSIPARLVGIHWCFESKIAPSMQPNPIALFQLGLNLIIRARFRAHCGKSLLFPLPSNCCAEYIKRHLFSFLGLTSVHTASLLPATRLDGRIKIFATGIRHTI